MAQTIKPIVLVGPMGAGKTTIGKALALRLQGSFADMDDIIVRTAHGMSIPEIFKQHGEPYFRQLEHDCLEQTLKSYAPLPNGALAASPATAQSEVHAAVQREAQATAPRSAHAEGNELNLCILAGGGGIAMAEANRALLKEYSICLYLNLPVEQQYERVKGDTNRPMLYAPDVKERLQNLYASRDPQYRDAAATIIDANASISEVVNRCCQALKQLGVPLS